MRWLAYAGLVVLVGIVWSAEDTKPTTIVKPDALKTLVNPDCSHCKDEAKRRAELRDDDRVLCWIRGKYDGGAIPLRFYLAPFRVISDTYGVFVYDADAGFVRGYEPSLDFRFHGWRSGIMVLKHKDGTLYSALSGVAFDGPNKGQQLKVIPTVASDWGFWLKSYPDTVAYKMYPKYQPEDLPKQGNADSVQSRPKPDSRLPAETPVLGVRIAAKTKAYPQTMLEKTGVIADEVDGHTILVLWYAPTRTAAAYEAVVAGKPIALHVDRNNPLAPFVDDAGVHWDIAGRAIDGQQKGKTLTWVDSVQAHWFAWAAEYPQTALAAAK